MHSLHEVIPPSPLTISTLPLLARLGGGVCYEHGGVFVVISRSVQTLEDVAPLAC